jgi:site-specific DNA recombinase
LSHLKSKIDTIEERFAIGEIEKEIYIKFKAKYESEEKKLESNLFSSTISSSNLQIAIDKALKMSSNLSELWVSGDLSQKKKIQSLVFPSGIGYDKLKGKVQTKRVNSIFSAIPEKFTLV